ncbi:hypothetical protein M514_11555 [Trichuris suis]|uniref:Uncharacterized protein n=1 Tax=Trichuris suis TaxID=68888 RepID=A0A085NHU7_9BILA|nr:hypothetical protein M514_11555 [Trichuris suis]
MCSPDVPCTGWSVVARLHYGEDLSDYVGFSVAVFDLDLDALAKATSILVFVGVGSYVAYRVLLGTLNTVDLLQAFLFYVETQWYSSKKSDTSEYEVNGNSVHSSSGEAQPTVVKVISSNCSSVEALAEGKSGANLNCDLTVAARPERNGSSNVAQSLTLSCHSSPLHSRHFRSCSRNSSVSFLNDSSGSCLSSTPFLWDYEWAAFADHPPSIAKRRSTSSGLSPRKRALLSSNGLCSYSDFSSDHSQVYSRDPSEWSEIVESKLVGESTIAQFDQLQGDIVELRSEMETFKSDCDRYMVDRQTTLSNLKSLYWSVPPASSDSGSSLPDVECPSPSSSSTNMIMMASCDSVCTCRPSSSSVLCPSCGTQIPTSRCRGCSADVAMPSAIQDSYHSFISTDLVPSVCSTSGGDVAAMGASFIDSCISSFDDNCLASLSCSSSAAVGRLPKVKSLDVEHASRLPPANWILVDLNDFLCKHTADSLKLSHVTCQLIHKRAMQQVFVPFASQLNIVQAILYHMCLARRRPLADAFTNSIKGFMNWFAQCDLPEGVMTASCMQSLAATESWLGQMEHEEVESGVRNFEANLSLYETALKVLIACNVLIRHSSIVSEEEPDSSHGVLCDQSETTSIFVNTLQKSAEDFSYTEIASLAKILNVTVEVFELYADLPRLLVRYPNAQSADGGHEDDYSRCLPLLSVVPCNYFPVL